jgi:hypothetical protein
VQHSTFEAELRARVAARAAELGYNLSQLLRRAGMSREFWNKKITAGHRLDTLIKLAEACDWSLAELLGVTPPPPRLLFDLTAQVFAAADRVARHLPETIRTPERRVQVFVQLYNEALRRQQKGLPTDEQFFDSAASLMIEILISARAEDSDPDERPR